MGLDFAIDALYESGWTADVGDPCKRHVDGRFYPSEELVQRFFADHGFSLTTRHIQLFDCYRAEWRDDQGQGGGAVVGQTAEEAGVYAMSQLRRHLVGAKN
jgi:hypothetical protein